MTDDELIARCRRRMAARPHNNLPATQAEVDALLRAHDRYRMALTAVLTSAEHADCGVGDLVTIAKNALDGVDVDPPLPKMTCGVCNDKRVVKEDGAPVGDGETGVFVYACPECAGGTSRWKRE